MIRPIRWIRCLLIPLLLATSSSAVAMTGNELLQACKQVMQNTDVEFASAGRCIGYLEGGRDGLSFAMYILRQLKPGESSKYCVPNEVTNGQMARVVVKYLESNPARLHEQSLNLLLFAMIEAFPCGR